MRRRRRRCSPGTSAIVAAVTQITAGNGVGAEAKEAFAQLSERLAAVIEPTRCSPPRRAVGAHRAQIVSNAAVLLFGGIETTEGMIAKALLQLLERPDRAD